jgi:hypothetical protein
MLISELDAFARWHLASYLPPTPLQSPYLPFYRVRGGRDAEGVLRWSFVDPCRGGCSDAP